MEAAGRCLHAGDRACEEGVRVLILTLGSFTLLHRGHTRLLTYGNLLSGGNGVRVGLNTDRFIKEYKGHPPAQDYEERAELLGALRVVKGVWPNDGYDARPCIESMIVQSEPATLLIGSDWHSRDYLEQLGVTWEWLGERRIGITYVQRTPGISSTRLRSQVI